MDYYPIVLDFVKTATKSFDSSHDYLHALAVYNNALKIVDMLQLECDLEIIMFASLLHDVCDHKYKNAITIDQLTTFVHHCVPLKSTVIMDIIDNVSYSKEIAGRRKVLAEPYNVYLDIVSDADKLEALGETGLTRCIQFTRARGGREPEDVIKHCYDKLLKLAPYYIRTQPGQELAKPLHQTIVNYVQEHQTCLFDKKEV